MNFRPIAILALLSTALQAQAPRTHAPEPTTADISVRDLMKLKAGDIIPINMPKALDICVENLPVFRGTFGVSSGRNALRISEVINREPNPTTRRN